MGVSKSLKTEDTYIQACKREDGTVFLSIYNNHDECQFLEVFFSKREFDAVIKTLTDLRENK